VHVKAVAQDWSKLRVYPLSERRSLTRLKDILLDPDQPIEGELLPAAVLCAEKIRAARARGAGVILMYGAHLLRNGAAPLLERMMEAGWLTHLATNGAATIHDWEYSWLGRSTESVRENVATGTFGSWDETARAILTALAAATLRGEGYGVGLGRFIEEDGAALPTPAELSKLIAEEPANALTPARAEVLQALLAGLAGGQIHHPNKQYSILASAYRHGVPMTVHPGIGYDIIVNHPLYSGGLVGRAAGSDFRLFSDSVETLDGGVVLSIGSAIMAPQVFEKSLSSVNNLRLQAGRGTVAGHSIFVVDLQDGGGWDWSVGEPPKSNPAYYLRFCKSFARMGAVLRYIQADNALFIRHLHAALS